MVVKTRVTELLGIEHPIIVGGMTGCGTPELCAACSNAGGLGTFAIHNAGSPGAYIVVFLLPLCVRTTHTLCIETVAPTRIALQRRAASGSAGHGR